MEWREESFVMTKMTARQRRTGAFFPFTEASYKLIESDDRGGAVSGLVDC